jgi:hypothetical protein
MKLEIKEIYTFNGKEYDSLEQLKEAKIKYNQQLLEESPQKKSNFSLIPVYDVDISNLIFHHEIYDEATLLDLVEMRQKLSNEQYRYVLPTYSEIKKLQTLKLIPEWLPLKEFWTSTRFLYNTYISYDNERKVFNDIYPQYKRMAFLLKKENKQESWFRDPPIPNSIDEMIYLDEKQKGKIIYSY